MNLAKYQYIMFHLRNFSVFFCQTTDGLVSWEYQNIWRFLPSSKNSTILFNDFSWSFHIFMSSSYLFIRLIQKLCAKVFFIVIKFTQNYIFAYRKKLTTKNLTLVRTTLFCLQEISCFVLKLHTKLHLCVFK